MLAKIYNDSTKVCLVALGTDAAYYQAKGFVEMDIEKGYDGQYYAAGFAPQKPQRLVDDERINELTAYLSNTDWYVARFAETGVAVPADVAQARAAARVEISELRAKYEVENADISGVGVGDA